MFNLYTKNKALLEPFKQKVLDLGFREEPDYPPIYSTKFKLVIDLQSRTFQIRSIHPSNERDWLEDNPISIDEFVVLLTTKRLCHVD